MSSDISGLLTMGNGLLTLSVQILLILAAATIVAKVVDIFLVRYFKKVSQKININETQFVVLRRLAVLLVYIMGILFAASLIPELSNLGVSLLASAGIIAVVVGFAAQQTLSNVIAGVFIAIYQPFRVGDRLSIKDEYGEVEDITLRHTVIKTWQNRRLIIPNSKMSDEYIINYSIKDMKILSTLEIGISYDADINKAKKIMLEEARKHPNVLKEIKGKDNEFLSKEQIILVRLVELTDSAQKLRLYYWAPDQSTATITNYALLESIKKQFDKSGLEIPYPYHTIVYKKDLDKGKGR